MTGTEGTKGAMSDCLPALIAPRIRVVFFCRQQEYESLATPPILTYSPPPCLQIRRHDETAKHPEKEKKKAAKAEYDAARLAKAAGRRSEEDAKAAKAAKVKCGSCHQHDFQSFTIFPHPQRSGYSLLHGGDKLDLT